MSSVRVGISDVGVLVDDRVMACARAVRRKVAPRVLHIVGAVVSDDLPFEDTFGHRAEDC